MLEDIAWVANTMPKTDDAWLHVMALEQIELVRTFHRSFPMYEETPLRCLPALAASLGLSELYVKDESYRFGLNAFKVLGASYAMAQHMAGVLGIDRMAMHYAALKDVALRRKLGEVTFFTATDGNHGRGVAWAARQMEQKAVVFMPRGSRTIRLENIQREGATATIADTNYDGCVRLADSAAKATKGGILVQDTAFAGYQDIPNWIMQGYGTMVSEAAEQFGKRPTHIFIQAGVGSLAGAVQGYFANLYRDNPPIVIVVEPTQAACLYESAKAGDGTIRTVGGDMPTIMAGLACGEPNPISFDIVKNHANFFVSCPDWVTVLGMRLLARPIAGDPCVVSGESGAVGLGLLAAVMQTEALTPLRDALMLDGDARVLLFSTEGDTDPERYREIIAMENG